MKQMQINKNRCKIDVTCQSMEDLSKLEQAKEAPPMKVRSFHLLFFFLFHLFIFIYVFCYFVFLLLFGFIVCFGFFCFVVLRFFKIFCYYLSFFFGLNVGVKFGFENSTFQSNRNSYRYWNLSFTR
jgi:hypothetical protein